MRILFSSLDAFGHVFPLIPLAQAAAEQGHEILYAAGNNTSRAIGSAGLKTIPVGIGIRDAFGTLTADNPTDRRAFTPEEHMEMAIRVFGEVLPATQSEGLKPVIESFAPDLMIAEVGNQGATVAALTAGLPVIRHGFGRGHTSASNTFAKLAIDGLDESLIAAALAAPLIDVYPESLQPDDLIPERSRILMQPVPFAEAGEVPAIVHSGDGPLVYLTLGTAFGSPEVLKTALEGLAAHGYRVLVATGPSIPTVTLGDLPPNVEAAQWVPQADVIPHTSVVVNHGGSGTTLASLVSGVPQLFLPQGADQHANAEAVSDAGAGLQLLEPDPQQVEAAIVQLLGGEFKARAQAIAAEIAAMPTPAEIAERLPAYAREGVLSD